MLHRAILPIAFALVLGCRSSAPSPESALKPEPAAPVEGHRWLSQLVGEWDIVSTAAVGPNGELMKLESTEDVRPIGELWIQSVGHAEEYESRMTLGFDPARGGFTGTWIDSTQPTLWIYSGHLEEEGRALVLEAEGPDWDDPTRTTLYRDTIRIVSPDHRQLTSAVQVADGGWIEFMNAEYHRR